MQALDLFSRACTQWRAGGFSVVGLDYPAVFQVAQILGVKIDRKMLDKIQTLEAFELRKLMEKPDGKH